MRDEKVSSALLKFGIPSIIGFLVTAIFNFVDAIYVGGLGTSAIGAASVLFPFSLIMIGLGLLLGSGAAANISILLGKEDLKKVNQSASTALFGSIIIGIVVIAVSLIAFVPIMRFFGATENILPYAKQYGYPIIAGSIFSILNIVLNHIARSEGAAKLSMRILVLGAVLNTILDPLFIYTFHWGIKGAAIATIISQGISTLLLLYYFYSEKSAINISIYNVSTSHEILGNMIKIGIPYSVAQLLAGTSMGLINTAAAPYGDAAVAAVGIANRVFSLGIYAMIGFSKGYQPIAGYNFGANNQTRLKAVTITAVKWATCFCVALTIVQLVFAKPIISLFTHDEVVINWGIKTLDAYSYALPLFGFQIIYMTLFLAIGRAKDGFVLSLGRQGIFLIPVILFLPKISGINGVMFAQPIADVLTTALTLMYGSRFAKQRKMAKEIC